MNEAIRNTQSDDELDSVIDSYTASAGGPSHEGMLALIKRYPQYERELIDYTVEWFTAERTAPAFGEEDEELTEATVERHRAVIQDLIARHSPVSAVAAPTQAGLKGLLAEGKALGLSRKQLADTVRLSIPLIDKLDRRLIRYSTVPRSVIEQLAQVLGRQVDAVSQYLQGAPLLPEGASYKADEAPEVPEAQDFSEAVRSDSMLSPERKRELLEMTEGNAGNS